MEISWFADSIAQANDLYICEFGEQVCPSAHAYGPATRNHYLIHFVASGSGTLYCGGMEYPVRAGQGFLIRPDEETFYQASTADPWHYAWVGYRGRRAEELTRTAGLDALNRVFTVQHSAVVWQALHTMRSESRALRLSQLSAIGGLLRFLSLIAPAQDPTEEITAARQYYKKALWYLEGRFDRNVSIQETADFVGLSRSHLYRVMMAESGCSPKAQLLRIRMRHAEQLLSGTTLSLDEIARRIGLQTGGQLSAAFKAAYGVTPTQYRKARRT